jgi:prepilin-type N-terminal cleavage/methylation domain-containing protein
MKKGFTLIELLLVMGLFAVLSGFVVVNMLRPQIGAEVDTTISVLASDIKAQQIKAMVGDTDGEISAQPHGIYFQSDRYILFSGASYSAGDPTNFEVLLRAGSTFGTISFSSSQLIFSSTDGLVSGFVGGSNSVVLNHDAGAQQTLTVNRYGAVDID